MDTDAGPDHSRLYPLCCLGHTFAATVQADVESPRPLAVSVMLSLTLVFAALCLSVEAAKAAVAGKVEASRNFCVCVSCQAHARSVASPMPEELVLQVGP